MTAAPVLFSVIKAMNRETGLVKKKKDEPAEEPRTKICPFCKSELTCAARCPHCTGELLYTFRCLIDCAFRITFWT